MIITWDEPKRLANIDKHGLDFEDIDDFDWDASLITPSHSGRYKAIGKFHHRLVVVVYSRMGNEAISLVSMRPANGKERRLHEEG